MSKILEDNHKFKTFRFSLQQSSNSLKFATTEPDEFDLIEKTKKEYQQKKKEDQKKALKALQTSINQSPKKQIKKKKVKLDKPELFYFNKNKNEYLTLIKVRKQIEYNEKKSSSIYEFYNKKMNQDILNDVSKKLKKFSSTQKNNHILPKIGNNHNPYANTLQNSPKHFKDNYHQSLKGSLFSLLNNKNTSTFQSQNLSTHHPALTLNDINLYEQYTNRFNRPMIEENKNFPQSPLISRFKYQKFRDNIYDSFNFNY